MYILLAKHDKNSLENSRQAEAAMLNYKVARASSMEFQNFKIQAMKMRYYVENYHC